MLECNIPWFAENKVVQFNDPGFVPSLPDQSWKELRGLYHEFSEGRSRAIIIRLCGLDRWDATV